MIYYREHRPTKCLLNDNVRVEPTGTECALTSVVASRQQLQAEGLDMDEIIARRTRKHLEELEV